MADEEQPAAPAAGTYDPATLNTIIQQLMQPQQMPQPIVPQASSSEGRSWASLLGEAAGGGEQYGTPQQRESGGLRALMSLGTNMMANSGWAPLRTPMGQILATGLQGAQQSVGESQATVAAQAAAQQQYAEKQQEMQLARLKAVLPLLQLQGRQGLPSPFAQGTGGAAPSTNVATGGSIATVARDPSVPTAGQQGNNSGNLMADNSLPPGAIGRIPVAGGRFVAAFPDVPTGVAAQSDNLNAYKAAGVQTIRQAVNRWVGDPKANTDSYAADVAKAAGVDPDAPVDLSDPKIQRAFLLAQQPHESGKSWLAPADVDKGLALAAARRAAPPGATTATTTAPAPYKVASTGAIPPPPSSSSTAPAAATPAADDTFFPNAPPAATPVGNLGLVKNADGSVGTPGGGFQPPTTPPTTVPPAAAAPQQTSQADQPPAPPPVTTPPPPAPLDIKSAPDTTLNPEQYIQKHWTPLSPEEVARYAPGPENQLAVDRARQVQQAQADAAAARQTYLNVQSGRVPGDLNKSLSDMNTADARADAAEKDYNTAVQGLKTEGAKNLLSADDQQRQQLRADFKSIVTDPTNATALETLRGKQQIDLERAKGITASEEKVMQGLDETFDSAKSAVDQINLTRTLSQAAGDPTFVQQLQKTHPDLVRWIANLGGLSDHQITNLGTAGAMDAAMNKLISMARTGSGFQRMTNLDVQILSSQAPQGTDPQAWREAKLAYLQTYLERQMQYVTAVHELRSDNVPLQKARVQAQQQAGSVVPTVPSFTDQPGASASQQRAKWAADKGVQPGTFVIAPNGQLVIAGKPMQQQQQQQQQPQPQPRSLVPVD